MNIFISLELDDEFRYLTDNKELIAFYKELKQFIKQRLAVLKEQIDEEELTGTKMTVIMLPSDDANFEGLIYQGYSKRLTEKMKSCVTKDDIEYLKRRFSDSGL